MIAPIIVSVKSERNVRQVKRMWWQFPLIVGFAAIAAFGIYKHQTFKDRRVKPQPQLVITAPARDVAASNKSPEQMERDVIAIAAATQFVMPPIGGDSPLSVPEICWCLRENIRIEALQEILTAPDQITEFRQVVANYNERCRNYWSQKDDLALAQKLVALYRNQIIGEAVLEAREFKRLCQTETQNSTLESQHGVMTVHEPALSDPVQANAEVNHVVPRKNSVPMGVEVSGELPYQAESIVHEIDGGKKTKIVVHGSLMGAPLLSRQALRWQKKLTPESVAEGKNFYTRGSSQTMLVEIQGLPDSITKYSASGYEVWHYGDSSVRVNTKNHKVACWKNGGNLLVCYAPGSQCTEGHLFCIGSHQDDILRLQGTPTVISLFSDHEIWRYGASAVKIDSKTHRVVLWVNSGGNLHVQ